MRVLLLYDSKEGVGLMHTMLRWFLVILMCLSLSGCVSAQRDDLPKQDGFDYISATDARFTIGGIEHPSQNGGEYYRLSHEQSSSYPETVRSLAQHTSGATVRFRTDADEISLRVHLRSARTGMQHMADRGAFGMDVYTGEGDQRTYCGEPLQLLTDAEGFCESLRLPTGEKEVMIHLPLYAGISSMEIGLPKGASLSPAANRTHGTIAFYGSSITQGACASRPGSSYPHIVCRVLDADCLNLGFSSAALGEQAVAQYIASRKISAFVMDYDHNHTVEGLQQTHYPFYRTVRAAHPDIPILMLTQPVFAGESTPEQKQRQAIIRQSYERAVASGDQQVYYLCGEDFWDDPMPDLYTVDMLHPNDLGHYHMAQAVLEVLKPALDR